MPRCCRSGEKVASLVQHQSVNAWLASRGLRLCCATTERGGEGGRQQEAAAAAAFTATIASSSGAASLGPRTAAVAVTPHIIHGVLDQSLWWVNKPVFSFTEVLYSLQFAAADTRRWHHTPCAHTHTYTQGKGGSDARQFAIGTEWEPRAANESTTHRLDSGHSDFVTLS